VFGPANFRTLLDKRFSNPSDFTVKRLCEKLAPAAKGIRRSVCASHFLRLARSGNLLTDSSCRTRPALELRMAPMKPSFESIKDMGTTVCAVIGATLGIFNFVMGYLRGKPKLRVRARVRIGGAIATAERAKKMQLSKWDGLCIEVVNTGAVAVTINEVGFLLKDRERYVENTPGTPNAAEFPKELPPRTDLKIFLHPAGTGLLEQAGVKCAYVRTACERTFKGKASEVKILRKLMALPKKSTP